MSENPQKMETDSPINLHASYPEDPTPADTSSTISQGFRMAIDELSREGIAFRLMGLALVVGAVGASMQLIPTNFDNRQNAAIPKHLPKISGIDFVTGNQDSLLTLASQVTLFLAVLLLITAVLSLLLRLKHRFL